MYQLDRFISHISKSDSEDNGIGTLFEEFGLKSCLTRTKAKSMRGVGLMNTFTDSCNHGITFGNVS